MEEATQMIALCADAGILLAINQQMRYCPAPAAIRRLIARGDLGHVYAVTHLKRGDQDQPGPGGRRCRISCCATTRSTFWT
jgi:predicted dehydrogenase